MTGPPIRPELRGRTPYGAPQLDVPVRLNTNENPFPLPESVVGSVIAALADVLPDLNRYPDREAARLRAALAAYVSRQVGRDVSPAMIWAANGSNEIIQQLMQAFGGAGRSILAFEPTYSVHPLIALTTQTRYRALSRRSDFAIDVGEAIGEISRARPDIVIVCTPNNPTGTSTYPADIARIYDAMGAESVLVVDEAYAEFSPHPSAVTLLAGRPRLVVARTMSKAFAFAGARVGYAVADPTVVDALQLVRLPYHLSALTQAAAMAALAHPDELQAEVQELCAQRDRMADFARGLGLDVAESAANFVMLGGFDDAASAWRALLDRGVLVRDVGIRGWLRISAGTPEETARFMDALADILGPG